MQPFVDSCVSALSSCALLRHHDAPHVAWTLTTPASADGAPGAQVTARRSLVLWSPSLGNARNEGTSADDARTVSVAALAAGHTARAAAEPRFVFESVELSQLLLTFSFAASRKAPPPLPLLGSAKRRAAVTQQAWAMSMMARLADVTGAQLAVDAFSLHGEGVTAAELRDRAHEHYVGAALWKAREGHRTCVQRGLVHARSTR